MRFFYIGFLWLLIMQQTGAAQAMTPIRPELKSNPRWPTAQPADVVTPEILTRTFFTQISAPAGGKLDKDRLESLFLPSGRIAIMAGESDKLPADAIFLRPSEYADRSDQATARTGFFDRVLAIHIEQFGALAQVFAAYESRANKADEKPFARGVKAFDMLRCKDRWYIAYVTWERETRDLPIPEPLLHDGQK